VSDTEVAWYRQRWTLRLLLLFLLLYLGQNAVTSMFFKVTDFEWHLDHARALLHERPYEPGFVTYLPARFLLDALYLPLGAWASAAWFALFAIAWLLLPALAVGWEALLGAYRDWLAGLLRIAQHPDLSFLGFEPPRHQNQSLRALFARYLQGFGPDHPIHAGHDLSRHPLFLQFLALPTPWPARLYQGAVLLLGLLFAWLFRAAWRRTPASRLLAEWSVVPIVATLLSPLAWLHHFAVALPALWLSLALIVQRREGRGALLAAGCIALVAFVLQRDLLQHELSVLELSYKLDALAMMLLVALTLWLERRGGTARSLARSSGGNST